MERGKDVSLSPRELRPRGAGPPSKGAPIPNSLSPDVPPAVFIPQNARRLLNTPLHSSSGITSIAFLAKSLKNPTMKQIKPMPLLLHILLS